MTKITDLRKQIPEEIFDYQTLILQLKGYSSPRDRITRLIDSGEIIRIRKGLYVFEEAFRRKPLSLHSLANILYGPSYVSLEYALYHYGLIPERVMEITSVTPGRSKRYLTPVGRFSYRHIPLGCFASGMDLIVNDAGSSCLMAVKEKALVDKVHIGPQLRTISEVERYLLDDLRLSAADLMTFNLARITDYCKEYDSGKSALLVQFFEKFLREK